MTISDLIPWKRKDQGLEGQRQAENQLLDLQSQIDRLFEDFYRRPFGLRPFLNDFNGLGDFSPRMDIDESEQEITVSVELPGIKPEDVEISLEDNTLTISGEKQAEEEQEGKRYYRVERSYGSFSRRIPLPTEVEEEKIDASLKDGLLKVTLPKSKEAQQKSKRIPIKTG